MRVGKDDNRLIREVKLKSQVSLLMVVRTHG
jgi:hypothetical protein